MGSFKLTRQMAPQDGDDVSMTSRLSAVRRLVTCEKQFVTQMRTGVTNYVIALRHSDVISRTDHDTLFINLEMIQSLAEERLASLSDCDTAAAAAATWRLSAVYQPKLEEFCEAYETYCSGVRDSIRLLVELKRTAAFAQFIKSSESSSLTLSSFIKKPIEHIKDLVLSLQKVVSYTPQDHPDSDNLRQVLLSVRNSCNRINEQNLYASSLSLASTTRDVTVIAPSSVTSRSSSSDAPSLTSHRAGSSVTAASHCTSVISSIDTELLHVQRRLVFPKHIPMFQLATASHHLIYSGSLMLVEARQLTSLFAVLMSDLLLLTRPDPENGSLVVLAEPLSLQDIVGSSFHCSHPCDFHLSVETRLTSLQEAWQPHSLLLRAPSVELKCTWKNILEQRILTCKAQRQQLIESRSADNIV